MMNDQRSVTDQLETLLSLANKNGLYDAADWLKTRMPKPVRCMECEGHRKIQAQIYLALGTGNPQRDDWPSEIKTLKAELEFLRTRSRH
jgi:hypothetical protein